MTDISTKIPDQCSAVVKKAKVKKWHVAPRRAERWNRNDGADLGERTGRGSLKGEGR